MDEKISHTPPTEAGDLVKNTADANAVPDSKTKHSSDVDQEVEVENGHLAELEVDMRRVLDNDEEGDWDADTSPFPEVRAVVPETDDPGMPVNTFRAWFLGIVRDQTSWLHP